MTEKYEVYINDDFLSHEKSGECHLDMADGVEQVEITLCLQSKQWCQLTIHDEKKARGQVLKTHLQESVTAFIGENSQTTSATMISGPIKKGIWRLTYEIEGEEAIQAPLRIFIKQHQKDRFFDKEMTEDSLKYPVEKDKQGWVKGDLHTHTIFSDGKMTRENNLLSAKNQKLDFFVATDHQVVTHHWPKSDIAVYAGVELTTPYGHANYLGVDRLLVEDYQLDQFQDRDGIKQTIENNQENGLFSVNHPFLKPWDWQLGELPLERIDSLEICNDPTFADNTEATEKALKLWTILWQDGWKVPGVGGSDSHLLPIERYPESMVPSLIGDPATFVFVKKLNKKDLLKGIKNGHTMLSRVGEIYFSDLDETFVLPRQQLTKTNGTFSIMLKEKEVVKFEWILDGVRVQIDEGTRSTFNYQINDTNYHWLRVDIRSLTNEFLGTMTPVYWQDKSPTYVTWEEACHELN